MLNEMRIGRRLIASMLVSLGLATVLGVAAALAVHTMDKSTDYIVNVTAKKRTLAGELSRISTSLLAQERGIVLGSILQQPASVQQSKEQVQEAFAKADGVFKEYSIMPDRESDREAVSRIQEEFRAVMRAHDEVLQDIDRQQFDQVQKVFDDRVLPKLLVISTECDRLVESESARLTNVAQDANAKASVSQWVLYFLIALSLAASVPVLRMVNGIKNKLRRVAFHLADGSDQVANAANEVSSASQSLAQGASEQAASLQETAASSEEITSMTQKNAENSRQVADLMAQVDGCVSEANRALKEMVASMRDINASSDRISKIIKVIDEIAFQTNILALNAAVEAARAGEAGMGFAVVADEVRNLAQRCAQAAKDTADLIEESISKSGGGSTRLAQMENAIQAITQSTTKVRTLVDEVSLGSQEQARGIQHIAKSISQMEAMTQKTAANAEEGASASEELSAQAKNMATLVNELRSMVDTEEGDHANAWATSGRPEKAAPSRHPRSDLSAVPHPAGQAATTFSHMHVNDHAGLVGRHTRAMSLEQDFKEI
jgi:methyl-accepting chemotaxis protein